MNKLGMIRNSEVHTYKQCRLLWKWTYVLGRQRRVDVPALATGTLVHKVLEKWYRKGRKRGAKFPQDLVRKAHLGLIDAGEYAEDVQHPAVTGSGGDPIDIEELVYEMMVNYFREYAEDDHIEIIAPEMTFQVEVYDKKDKFVGVAVGQIDATVRDHDLGRVGFWEHKSGAGLEPFGAPLHLDEQNGMYWTYGPIFLEHLGIIKDSGEATFLMYNRLAKNIAKDTRKEDELGRKLNQDGTVSKKQPADKFLRTHVYRTDEERVLIDRRFQQVAKEMTRARNKKLAIYKNPDRHCGWCPMKEACEIHEAGGDYQAVLRSMTTTWNPYEDHEGKEVVRG